MKYFDLFIIYKIFIKPILFDIIHLIAWIQSTVLDLVILNLNLILRGITHAFISLNNQPNP